MNWISEAKRIFETERPQHFTNHTHCEECLDSDNILLSKSIDDIGIEELGVPGDPLYFCTDQGKKYFMPSFVRLALSTIDDEFYLGQLLFHLEGKGENNKLFKSCSVEQRQFIAAFIEFVIDNYTPQIESSGLVHKAVRVHEIWSNSSVNQLSPSINSA
jgi:hypothetical protein